MSNDPLSSARLTKSQLEVNSTYKSYHIISAFYFIFIRLGRCVEAKKMEHVSRITQKNVEHTLHAKGVYQARHHAQQVYCSM